MAKDRDLAQDIAVELETDNERLDRNALQSIKENAATGYYSTRPRNELITDLETAGAEQLAAHAKGEAYVIDQADRREDYEQKLEASQSETAATEPPPPPIDGELEGERDTGDAPDDDGTVVIDDPPPRATPSAETNAAFAAGVPQAPPSEPEVAQPTGG